MARLRQSHERSATRPIEWPTLAVAFAVYGGWLATTWWHAAIPVPLLVLLGGWIIAWHGSLQHETIHGHPTGNRVIDTAIGFLPLSLWLPYALYRRSHIAHHASPAITDPHVDPESRYVDGKSRAAQLCAQVQATLPGHMLFGPPIAIVRFVDEEIRRTTVEPGQVARDWLPHLAAVAALLVWLDHVGLSFTHYVLTFIYPGMALTTLRSHAEHRAEATTKGHAATVERGGVFALLFLNNNLHAAHHERPQLAWYRLPAYHLANRARLIGEGNVLYRGYGEIARRFAVRAHDEIVHPSHRAPRA